MLTENDVVAGKYRIVRVLGEGGMGIVYEAHHLHLEERVALKVIVADGTDTERFVTRFRREGRTAAKLKGEHVARVFDIDVLLDGRPFLVMELLEGSDLSVVRTSRRPLPITTAVDHVLQACEALAEAHSKGIVHRDIKPANLFVATRPDGSPTVKVLDFGISKVAGAPEAITGTLDAVGTTPYMSPEQIRASRDVDARTDLWSLGIVLFELLTARLPFEASIGTALVIAIVESEPLTLASLRADAPSGLGAVVGRCLEKDASRRFKSAGELATALGPFASAEGRLSIERIRRIEAQTPRGPAPPPAGASEQSTTVPYATPPVTRVAPVAVAPIPPVPPVPNTSSSWGLGRRGGDSHLVVPLIVLGGLVSIGLIVTGVSIARRSPASPAAVGESAPPDAAASPVTPTTSSEPLPTESSAPAQALPTAVPSSPPGAKTAPRTAPPPPPSGRPKAKPASTLSNTREG